MQFISWKAKEVLPRSATTMKNDLAVNDFHRAGKIRVQGQRVQSECFSPPWGSSLFIDNLWF